MNNSNNNNNISKSYKDYKYVYTGHEDYCKKHNIKTEKKLPKKEEQIIHDHRFVYDFNNPTQHTHDYSFNFNNPNEHTHDYSFDFSKNPQPKNITANSKTNYINTYQKPSSNSAAKPMATTAKSTSTPARSTTTRKTTYSYTGGTNTTYGRNYTTHNFAKTKAEAEKAIKIIRLVIVLFFVIPFIFSFLGIIFSSSEDSYDYEEEYNEESYVDTTNENYTNIDSYSYTYDTDTVAVNAFCNALKTNSIDAMKDRITYEELLYKNGRYWQSIINKYPSNASLYCTIVSRKYVYPTERSEIEDDFYNEYYEQISLSEAKKLQIKVTYYDAQNNLTTKYHDVVVGRINNKWYFINTKDIEY